MKTANPSRGIGAAMLGVFVLLVAVPTMMSLAREGGAICLSDSSCPLSAINPCVREPKFAMLGRCAIPIR